jgi:serine/threonine-protein kinase HipA
MKCHGCLKKTKKQEEFCSTCLDKLFNRSQVSSKLDFNWDDLTQRITGSPHEFSISGVQPKGFIGKVKNNLLVPKLANELHSHYIVKPELRNLRNPTDSPANEHVTMQIARQIYQLRITECALMTFNNDEPVYLTKRFDFKEDDTKYLQEDFVSVLEVIKENGEFYKYDARTYEDIANKLSSLDRIEFLRILLFNFLIGNGDAHLKNFSLLEMAQGGNRLSPGYDLLNTKIHTNDAPMALNLFKRKERTKNPRSTTYNYSFTDFKEFGLLIGIREVVINNIKEEFKESIPKLYDLVDRSFLSDTGKDAYKTIVKQQHFNLFNNRKDKQEI